MRAVWIGVISAIVSGGLLFVAFPFSTFYDNFEHSRAGVTLESYLLVGLMVGLIVTAVVVLLSHYSSKMHPMWLGALTGTVLLSVLIVGSVLMGPYQWDIPSTEVHMFFSEWNFTGFICQIAFPVSLLAAIMNWWAERREQKASRLGQL